MIIISSSSDDNNSGSSSNMDNTYDDDDDDDHHHDIKDYIYIYIWFIRIRNWRFSVAMLKYQRVYKSIKDPTQEVLKGTP